MDWLYYFILLVVAVSGLFINILGLPGLWLMVAAHAGYIWGTGMNVHAGWPSIIALVVLGLVAEALEFLAGAAGSKAAGGRKRGMIGAVVGALLGGLFLSVIPIPIISTIVGACLGAFIGAAIMEFSDKDVDHAMRVGFGAAKGRFWGILIKSGVGIIMLLVIIIAALPLGGAPVTAPPALSPATAPSPATLPSTIPDVLPSTTATSQPSF